MVLDDSTGSRVQSANEILGVCLVKYFHYLISNSSALSSRDCLIETYFFLSFLNTNTDASD